nr:MAG TPA: hypothetical protein [Caudoviricetes sp.]
MPGGGGHRTQPAGGGVAVIIWQSLPKIQGKPVELPNLNKI